MIEISTQSFGYGVWVGVFGTLFTCLVVKFLVDVGMSC